MVSRLICFESYTILSRIREENIPRIILESFLGSQSKVAQDQSNQCEFSMSPTHFSSECNHIDIKNIMISRHETVTNEILILFIIRCITSSFNCKYLSRLTELIPDCPRHDGEHCNFKLASGLLYIVSSLTSLARCLPAVKRNSSSSNVKRRI